MSKCVYFPIINLGVSLDVHYSHMKGVLLKQNGLGRKEAQGFTLGSRGRKTPLRKLLEMGKGG